MVGIMVLQTTTDVIKKLGGFQQAATLTGRGYTAVWNWGARGKFPANTYILINRELKKRGHSAPESLWRMSS